MSYPRSSCGARCSRINGSTRHFSASRRNLLLWLQLLLLALLILAAMQPFLPGKQDLALRYLALVDASASMAAVDSRGQSRMAAAKAQLSTLIDDLGSDQELAVVQFSNSAQLLQGFTSNGRLLRQAVDRLGVEDLPGDLEAGLRMAEAMARATPIDRVMLFSDGNLPTSVDFALPFPVEFQKVGQALGNVGIVAVRANRSGRRHGVAHADLPRRQRASDAGL